MATIKSKVPHPVSVLGEDNKVIKRFPKNPKMARIKQKTTKVREIDGVPLSKTSYGEVLNLPEPCDEIFYIVSHLVKLALPDREDLLVPTEVVRDDANQIIGCKSLSL